MTNISDLSSKINNALYGVSSEFREMAVVGFMNSVSWVALLNDDLYEQFYQEAKTKLVT